MLSGIEPLQLAVKFYPPKIALLYSKAHHTYLHEFPIQELNKSTQAIVNELQQSHPGYLYNLNEAQISRLVDLIKSEHDQDHSFSSRPMNLSQLLKSNFDLQEYEDSELGEASIEELERELAMDY
mmetsp:Transcript_9875/g.19576  ORF Transcript_9875/g.19576 Transcript_9875/m.19576 type:complete len:125 (-) Transcript_9875:2677-3051(-)